MPMKLLKKGIVVVFPGSRGTEIPLLYYGSKHFEDIGYEKLFIDYSMISQPSFETVFENAYNILKNMNWAEYEEVVFIGKSLGTVVACKIKERLQVPAKLILFTPLEETLLFIHKDNDVLLVAIGDEDPWLSSTVLLEHCKINEVTCHVEHGVGHRMEVKNDLQRNLEIVLKVLSYLSIAA